MLQPLTKLTKYIPKYFLENIVHLTCLRCANMLSKNSTFFHNKFNSKMIEFTWNSIFIISTRIHFISDEVLAHACCIYFCVDHKNVIWHWQRILCTQLEIISSRNLEFYTRFRLLNIKMGRHDVFNAKKIFYVFWDILSLKSK